MDELNKKRKAGTSPDEDSMKADISKKKTRRGTKTSNVGESKNGRRSRTPSGMDLDNIVSQKRTIFSQKPRAITKNVIPRRTTQTKISQAFNSVSAGKKSINHAIKNHLKRQHGSTRVNSVQNNLDMMLRESVNENDNSSGWEDAVSSQSDESINGDEDESDMEAEHENSTSKDQSDSNDTFIKKLLSAVPTCENSSMPTYGAEANKSQPSNTNGTTTDSTGRMETNCSDNPPAISTAAVIAMFRELRKDLTKATNTASQHIKQELDHFKGKCVEEASAEISQAF